MIIPYGVLFLNEDVWIASSKHCSAAEIQQTATEEHMERSFYKLKKNVDYLYCLGEQMIGQNPNQRGDAEIPCLPK